MPGPLSLRGGTQNRSTLQGKHTGLDSQAASSSLSSSALISSRAISASSNLAPATKFLVCLRIGPPLAGFFMALALGVILVGWQFMVLLGARRAG